MWFWFWFNFFGKTQIDCPFEIGDNSCNLILSFCKSLRELPQSVCSFLFSKDNEYVYFYLKINRILKENSINEKYISSIKFITKKYSSKGVLLNKIDKDIQFKEHEQDIVEKILNEYLKNSMIFILKIQ